MIVFLALQKERYNPSNRKMEPRFFTPITMWRSHTQTTEVKSLLKFVKVKSHDPISYKDILYVSFSFSVLHISEKLSTCRYLDLGSAGVAHTVSPSGTTVWGAGISLKYRNLLAE